VKIISGFNPEDRIQVSFLSSPSHFIFNNALAKGLAARGHNLTIVSPDIEKKPVVNIHYIHLEQVYAYYYK
jgi:glucuronosyltransferase